MGLQSVDERRKRLDLCKRMLDNMKEETREGKLRAISLNTGVTVKKAEEYLMLLEGI